MINLHIRKVVLGLALSLMANACFAFDLSQDHINDYLQSIDLLQNSDDQMIKALENSLKNNKDFKFDTDEDGNIKIVSQMLAHVSDGEERALTGVIEDAGFSSLSEWAKVADRIGAAMMAIEMNKNPMDMDMSEITPEMMEMMPPAIKEQMAGALRMMDAVKNVPKEDIKIVQENYAKLMQKMDN